MIATKLFDLERTGELKLFVRAGVIPIKVVQYMGIYKHYISELDKNRRCNDCIMQSVSNTCEQFKVGKTSVYRAINFMQQNEDRSANSGQKR